MCPVRRLLCLSFVLACLATTSVVSAATASSFLVNRTLRLGSTYTITGTDTVGSTKPVLGRVRLLGSWDGARWRVISTTRVESRTGRFRIVLRPSHRGVLRLRLEVPGGGVYPVTLVIV